MTTRSETLAMLSVLVVDDSPVMRRLIIRAFELANIALAEVHEASDGLVALERLRNRNVDLVLCDLNMPNMGGIELLRAMHEDGMTERVPVIVISSNRGEGLNAETRALGVRAYVHKPFRPEAFGRLVRDVLALGEPS